MDTHAQATVPAPSRLDEESRWRSFAAALEAVRKDALSCVGPGDIRHVRRLQWFSRACEAAGRLLLHFSFEPFTFAAGVLLLWLRKQLHAAEIGHVTLHGTYDHSGGGKAFSARTFRWDSPIDEASWRYGHNQRHHGATNVAEKDADMQLGPVRLSYCTPYHPVYRYQLFQMLVVILPAFRFWMAVHFSGLLDLLVGYTRPERCEFLPDRSWASARAAWRRAGRKWLPYYFKNYVFFPALAGAMFWKVLLGNMLAELLCDLYTGCGIICSHNGPETRFFPAGTKPRSQGEWYAMQVEATNNFAVYHPFSVLLGALDYQIEHHLFPSLAPVHLRRIAPQVQAICEAHGVSYRRAGWGTTLMQVFRQIQKLSRYDPARELHPPLPWFPPRAARAGTGLPSNSAGNFYA